MHQPENKTRQGAPRMLACALITLALIVLAHLAQATAAGGLLAVTLYKAHLLALGGWGGYWLDRALFPYDRPHDYLLPEVPDGTAGANKQALDELTELQVITSQFGQSMLRRAVVVAACLVCVGLGA